MRRNVEIPAHRAKALHQVVNLRVTKSARFDVDVAYDRWKKPSNYIKLKRKVIMTQHQDSHQGSSIVRATVRYWERRWRRRGS